MSATSAEAPVKRNIFLAPPDKPLLPKAEQEKAYPRLRFQVFAGIFLGYAAFYLIRNNISLIAPILLKEGHINKTGIGLIANAVLLAYGFSKFFMATISDRCNARYFLPIGLALSAVANLVVSFVPGVTATVGMFALVMFFNGWFQGMGWPPCARVLVHWFSTNERGWKTALWNLAHNVGAIALGFIASWGLSITGNKWQSAFYLPAILALILAVASFILIRDRPAMMGLPPIEEHRNDPAKTAVDDSEVASQGYWRIVVNHVLKRRAMVLIALANIFAYLLRYGVESWAPTFLVEVHHQSATKGIAGFSLFEFAGMFGILSCGWMSDKVFKGNRSKAGVLFTVLCGVALLCYWLAPVGTPFGLLMVFLACIGGFIYGPVMLIGLQAIDMSARQVAGVAAGFTGLFGYAIGATMSSTGVGYVVQHFGWNAAFACLTGAVVLCAGLLAAVIPEENRMLAAHRKASEEQNKKTEAAA